MTYLKRAVFTVLIAAPVDGAVYRKTSSKKALPLQIRDLWRTAKASISSAMSQWREIRRTHARSCSPLSAVSWIYAASIRCPAGRCRLATADGGTAAWRCLRPPSSSPSGHCLKHTQQYCGERDKERGGSVKARCQGVVRTEGL